MILHNFVVVLLFLSICSSRKLETAEWIGWTSLSNPILSYTNWAIKDVYVQEKETTFYLFFSAFFTGEDKVFRSCVAEVWTKDFINYSNPVLIANGTDDGWIGMCSPNITPLDINGTTYLLTLNSWGDDPKKPDQLFYMLSSDLITWSKPRLLAPKITAGIRGIDAAVAYYNNKYYLIWKSKEATPGVPQIAISDNLDDGWKLLGTPSFHCSHGTTSAAHENFDFINIDGKWKLLSTDTLLPFLYSMKGSGLNDTDWLDWTDGYQLLVVQKEWNSKGSSNAAAFNDWRKYDGYYYLFYAGENETTTFHGRGHEKIGVSRSKDLVNWMDAGQPGDLNYFVQ